MGSPISVPTNVYIVESMVFPIVTNRCDSRAIQKAEHQRIVTFKLWCWRRLLTSKTLRQARRSNQSILKEINPEDSLEGLMLKLELQYLVTWCEELTQWKRPWWWERLNAGEKATEDEMVRWQHWYNEHEPGQTLGDCEWQRGLMCYSLWDCKMSDTTRWLNNNFCATSKGHFISPTFIQFLTHVSSPMSGKFWATAKELPILCTWFIWFLTIMNTLMSDKMESEIKPFPCSLHF